MPADRTRYSTEEKVAAGLGALGALAIAVSVPAAWDPVATVGLAAAVGVLPVAILLVVSRLSARLHRRRAPEPPATHQFRRLCDAAVEFRVRAVPLEEALEVTDQTTRMVETASKLTRAAERRRTGDLYDRVVARLQEVADTLTRCAPLLADEQHVLVVVREDLHPLETAMRELLAELGATREDREAPDRPARP